MFKDNCLSFPSVFPDIILIFLFTSFWARVTFVNMNTFEYVTIAQNHLTNYVSTSLCVAWGLGYLIARCLITKANLRHLSFIDNFIQVSWLSFNIFCSLTNSLFVCTLYEVWRIVIWAFAIWALLFWGSFGHSKNAQMANFGVTKRVRDRVNVLSRSFWHFQKCPSDSWSKNAQMANDPGPEVCQGIFYLRLASVGYLSC